MASYIYDKKYNDYINELNEYIVSTDGIFKKITDDENKLLNITEDIELTKLISMINSSYDKESILKRYLQKNYVTMEVTKIKLEHYRSESDTILVTSHGNNGLKLTIKFRDYTILEESLCMDDYECTKKEDIMPQINNRFHKIKENYSYLCVYLYTKIYKNTLLQETDKILIPSQSSVMSSIEAQAGGDNL